MSTSSAKSSSTSSSSLFSSSFPVVNVVGAFLEGMMDEDENYNEDEDHKNEVRNKQNDEKSFCKKSSNRMS